MATTREKAPIEQGVYTMGTGMGEAPSGYGNYDSLFQNNPYRNLQYNKSDWQEFLGMLGFRTDYDRWQEEAQANAAEWDAGVFQKMYDEAYNSETAKAQRMRQAGENPDLLGTAGVSEANQMQQDPQGMTAGMPDNVSNVATGLIGCFNNAVGMVGQYMQLMQIKSGIEGQNIDNAENMMNIITQRVMGMTPKEGFKNEKEFQDWKANVSNALSGKYGEAFFKGSSLRRWRRSIEDFIGGLPQSRAQFEEWNKRMNEAKEYWSGSADHWAEAKDVFDKVNEALYALRKATTENKAVAGELQSEVEVQTETNELQYQEDLEPGQRARAQNEEWKRKAEGNDFQGILAGHLAKLGHELDDLSKEGGLKGFLAEVFLFFLNSRFSVGTNGKGGISIGGGIQMPELH